MVDAPDAEREMIAHLRTNLSGVVTVSPAFPDSDRLHVQVEQEGGSAQWPIVERAQVRLVAWAPPGERTTVKNLAAEVMRLAAAHPGNASVAGVQVLGARSAVSTDPNTKRVACWVLVRVNLKH